jgi:tryptophan 2,3-dioxygenase
MTGAMVASGQARAGRTAATYAEYLRLDLLLQQQERLTEPPARDELLFIVAHQVCELWFKLLLDELDHARAAMLDGQPAGARRVFLRIHALQRLLTEQLGLLETMSPGSFEEFRAALGTSSAFQSVQAREVEFLSGAKDARYVRAVAGNPADRARLRRRLGEPSIWEAFERLLAGRWPAAAGTDERLLLLAGLTGRGGALPGLAQDLLEYDRLAEAWRRRHAGLVETLIGGKHGTAGSPGISYLRQRLGEHYYPRLWAALGQEAGS